MVGPSFFRGQLGSCSLPVGGGGLMYDLKKGPTLQVDTQQFQQRALKQFPPSHELHKVEVKVPPISLLQPQAI